MNAGAAVPDSTINALVAQGCSLGGLIAGGADWHKFLDRTTIPGGHMMVINKALVDLRGQDVVTTNPMQAAVQAAGCSH